MNQPDDTELPANEWSGGYFNYFTEIEEHFQRARGTALFLLSPLDWALIENWKNSGVPLEAVLKGVDDAFEKWRSRKVKTRQVNSLAYCAQAVSEAAQRLSGAGAVRSRQQSEAPFSAVELQTHLGKCASALRDNPSPAFQQVSVALEELAAEVQTHLQNLEDLERRLTVLEDKMVAIARGNTNDQDLLTIRRDLDAELQPYRGKMTADQLAMLERRYLDTRLMERAGLPRLSLFYFH